MILPRKREREREMKEEAIFSIREILCPLLIIERAALKLIKMFKLINRNGRKIRWNRSRRKCEMRKRIGQRDAMRYYIRP